MQSTFKIVVFFILLLPFGLVYGQEDESVPFEEIDTILNKVILKKEMMGGGTIHSAGLGILFRKGYNPTAFKKNLWELEFVGIRSQKQVRINFYGAYYSNANSYVYGKLNKVYVLRAGLGQQFLITRKPYWGGVELRFAYYGGLSLGMAKPIYLYIINQNDYNSLTPEKYNPDEHFIDNIYGRAPFLDGVTETKFHPGLYIKAGLDFYFGQYNTSIKNMEIGFVIDGYVSPIPIMAFRAEYYYFANVYLSVTFGKRYNKF
jgi:hypothetical protein